MNFFGILSSLIYGITYGLILSLMAAGLSLIYGVMKNVNTSHGAFYMLGGFFAYLGYVFFKSFIWSLIFAVLGTFFVGMGVLPLVIPKRYWTTLNADEQNTVMIIFLALATFFEYLVLILFGGGSVQIPSLFYGNINIFSVYLTKQILFASLVSIGIYILLYIFLKYTSTGIMLRAFSQNKELSEACGINGERIALLAFGLGVALAGLTGAFFGSIFSINSASGWEELVESFVIVTFGGIGSIFGSLVGGLIFGTVYSFLLLYYPQYAFEGVLLVIFIILLLKPTGLLGGQVERV